ncbi:unnamed protein product [Boreogadus saida]
MAIKSKPLSVVGNSTTASKVPGPRTNSQATTTEPSGKLSRPLSSTGSSSSSSRWAVSGLYSADGRSTSSSVTVDVYGVYRLSSGLHPHVSDSMAPVRIPDHPDQACSKQEARISPYPSDYSVRRAQCSRPLSLKDYSVRRAQCSRPLSLKDLQREESSVFTSSESEGLQRLQLSEESSVFTSSESAGLQREESSVFTSSDSAGLQAQ